MKQFHELRSALPLFRCLGSEIRVSILELLLSGGPMCMTDIASELKITNGSLSPHIRELENSGLITVTAIPGKHGTLRLCNIAEHQILIDLLRNPDVIGRYETEIAVGQYTAYSVYPTCGISTPDHLIGTEDEPCYFASPERVDAGILWMGHGYVEYIVPNYLKPDQRLKELLISMEISSEAPGYREDWPSDITFSINGVDVCTWTLPGDFGKVRGIYTPKWWNENWNQYGQLKFLSVDNAGSYIDGIRLSGVTLKDLNIMADTALTFRISAPADAVHSGGLTVFGQSFGNYNQDIRVRMEYISASAGM
ncbi:MAG: ArsR family transcriptional regulator [Clostridia bacterium]|nr:ArsR family transcriptional regulator [Clostridia bacterium]